MENFKRIMVPLDGSELSELAFGKALSLARLVGGKLWIVHITEPVAFTYTGYEGAEINSAIDLIETENLTGVKRYMKRFEAKANELGIPLETVIERGSVEGKLVEMSKDFDLIIMGSRGRNMISSLLLGSVAEYVSRHASCPVMLVRETKEDREKGS